MLPLRVAYFHQHCSQHTRATPLPSTGRDNNISFVDDVSQIIVHKAVTKTATRHIELLNKYEYKYMENPNYQKEIHSIKAHK